MRNKIKPLIDPIEVEGTHNLENWEVIAISVMFTMIAIASILKDLS